LAGAFKGAARKASIKAGFPSWPAPDPLELVGPLHDPWKKTITTAEKAQSFPRAQQFNPLKINLRSEITLAFSIPERKHDFRLVLQELAKVSVLD
jgi:hypothetical protein